MSGDSYYDVAQICSNGHVINSMTRFSPDQNQIFCDRCGAKTITKCESCGTPIRGYYHIPGALGGFDYKPPAFCFQCGKPFSWTTQALQAASDLADTFDHLNAGEREALKDTLPDLVNDTPRSVVAQSRFKALFTKVGKDGYDSMKAILVNVLSEAVRKQMFGA